MAETGVVTNETAVVTKRIRIAIAINDLGYWSSFGYAGAKSDKEMIGYALEGLDNSEGTNEVVHFVEVEVPIPQSVTLEGEMS